MDEKLVVSKWETILMLVNLISLKSLTVYPTFLKTLTSTGGWLAALCGSLVAVFITWITVMLYRRYADYSYAELLEKRYGSAMSHLLVIMAVVSMVITFSFFADFISNSLSVTHYSATPKWLLCLILIIPAIHGAYKGVGATVRLSALTAIAMLVLFAITFLSVINDANLSEMYPVFGKNYPSFFKGVLFSISVYSDFFQLLFLMPNVEKKKDMSYIWKRTMIISSAIFILTVIMVQTSFMPEGYSAVSSIDRVEGYVKIGRFYARTQRLFSIVWLISYICSFSVYFSHITAFMQALTGLDRRFIITAGGVIVFVISVASPPLADAMTWMSFAWLGLPILTGLKRRERSR